MKVITYGFNIFQIYGHSSLSDKNYLDRREFITALKLIAIHQAFGSLNNFEEHLASAKVPLAKFGKGHQGPPEEKKQSGIAQQEEAKVMGKQ